MATPGGKSPVHGFFTWGLCHTYPKGDVDTALAPMKSWGSNRCTSNGTLGIQLLMFLTLTSACCCGELASLDLRASQCHPGGISFPSHRAQEPQGSLTPWRGFFPDDPELCPVNTLEEFRAETLGLKGNSTAPDMVILSLLKPHKPVNPYTLSHWHWLIATLQVAVYDLRNMKGLTVKTTGSALLAFTSAQLSIGCDLTSSRMQEQPRFTKL